MDEAKAALTEARRLNPNLTVKWLFEHSSIFRRCSTACARRGCRRNERDPETRGDLGLRRGRLQPARRRGRGSHLARLRALRSDLIDPTIAVASRPCRQAHRRRQPHRIPQRRRRGALRDRSPERHGRAQRRRAARTAHRISRRHPSRRRGRGERRRPDGRRRQYRRATGGHRRARARSVFPRTPIGRSRDG